MSPDMFKQFHTVLDGEFKVLRDMYKSIFLHCFTEVSFQKAVYLLKAQEAWL